MNIFVLYFFIISTVSLIRSEIIIFENSHRKLPHNIEDRYILLQKIYNDCIYCPYGGAWKDKQVAQDSREIKKKAEIEKQELFSNMIKNIAKNKDSKELMTLFKNAFIISAENKETTFNGYYSKNSSL